MPGSKVVEHSTHISKIKGLNPATGIERERENGKKTFFQLMALKKIAVCLLSLTAECQCYKKRISSRQNKLERLSLASSF